LGIVAVSTDEVLASTHFTWLSDTTSYYILGVLADLRPKISIYFSLLHSWWPR